MQCRTAPRGPAGSVGQPPRGPAGSAGAAACVTPVRLCRGPADSCVVRQCRDSPLGVLRVVQEDGGLLETWLPGGPQVAAREPPEPGRSGGSAHRGEAEGGAVSADLHASTVSDDGGREHCQMAEEGR
ncbi:hypothetical protein FKM82_003395 [Ascaphus truei]